VHKRSFDDTLVQIVACLKSATHGQAVAGTDASPVRPQADIRRHFRRLDIGEQINTAHIERLNGRCGPAGPSDPANRNGSRLGEACSGRCGCGAICTTGSVRTVRWKVARRRWRWADGDRLTWISRSRIRCMSATATRDLAEERKNWLTSALDPENVTNSCQRHEELPILIVIF